MVVVPSILSYIKKGDTPEIGIQATSLVVLGGRRLDVSAVRFGSSPTIAPA